MPKDFINLQNSKKSKLSSRTTMRLLEQRFMFDAAIATTVADAQNTSDPHLDAAVHNDINAKPLATDASHDTNISQNIDPSKDTSKTILSDFTANAATTPKQTTQVTDEKSAISYMNGLPLSFEANKGQNDPSVKFAAKGADYGMYLTNDGIYFSLLGNDSTSPTGKSISNISLKFVDGNTQNLIGVHELQGKHNYIQSSKSVTDIPLYEKAKYESVYQGIDAIVYGNSQNELEYDFVVAPNADASQIAVEIAGATKLEIDANGRLLVHTKDGTLWQDAPVLYQYNGAQKTAIDGKFVLDGNHLKFDIANYDHSKTLFIDPIFSYGSYVGELAAQNQLVSSDTELAGTNVVNLLGGLQRFGIKIHNDDLYIAGETIRTQLDSPAFPVTAGSFDVTQNGSFDVFVAKLRPQGNGASDLIYSTYIGSVGDDKATMLDVNALGEVYVAGETSNPNGDFPTTLDAYDTTANGGKDVFVSKLSADGTTLLYSTLLGGSGDDAAYHIVVDANGKIYLTGETTSSDLPATSGAFQTSNSGGVDVFVAKIDPSHTGTDQLVYATYYGGASNEAGYGLTIDTLGNAYIVGKTIGTIPTTPNAFLTSAPGGGDGFLFKLDPTGTALLYGTYFGGTGSELIDSVALDPSGNVFIAGSTSSSNLSTNTAFDTTLGRTNNGQDAIVAKFKLNNGGGNNDLLASTYFGGGGSENAREIKVDANGNVFIVGFTSANDPVPTTGTDSKTITGAGTIGYFSKFDNNLSNLLFSTHFGAASGISNNNNTTAVSTFDISNTGQVALIGTTTRDLETSTGAFDENFNTGPDAVNPLVNIFIQSYSIGNTNQAPTNPTGFNLADIPEDVPSGSNTGTLVSDIVAGSGSIDSDSAPLGIAVTNAANTNGIWQFSTDNGASWNAIGSVSVANALLLNETDKIRFVSSPNFNGNDQVLGFKVWDKSSGTAGTTAITNNGETAFSVNAANALLDVTPINDAPDIVVPATKNIFQGDQIFFRNQDRISFSDIDIGGEDARVTLSVTHGTLTIAGSSTGLNFITGDGTNDTDMIFTGNLADINAAVSNLLFRSSSSNFSGTSTLTVNISDQGHTGATGPLETTKFVDIHILSFPQSQFAQEDINKPIQGISINNEFSSVDLLVLNGTLTLSNIGSAVISNNGSESVSISGNFNDINATLDTLIYKGNLNFNGGDGLLVSAIGLQEVINSAIAIFVNPVNDAPTNPENLDLPSLPEDVAPASNTGTLVSDIVTESGSTDVDSTPLGIAVTNAAITNGIWQFSTDNGANWNAIGIVSETNALLLNETDKIRFVPNANFNGNDQPLGFKVWDKSSGTAGSLANTSSSTAFSVNPANALLDVTPVNDAPTNPNNFDLAAIPEDILSGSNTGTLVSDIVTESGSTDVDSAPLGIAVTNAAITNGIWQFSTDNGANWNAIDIVSETNALLLNETDKIRFVPNANFNGNDQVLGFKVWDKSSGTAGSQADTSASTAFSVNPANALLDVTPVNDAPMITVPGPQNVNENTSLAISGISFTDPELTSSNTVQVTISVDHGMLTLSTNSLSFITGDGADDATMVFTGNLADINAALATLSYQGNLNFVGADTLNITINDQGNTGATGPLSDSNTIAITVNPINDRASNPANLDLTSIPEDIPSGSNTGTLVSDIVTGSGSTDSDSTPLGIAVTNAENTNGIWQFSTDNGASWNSMPPVTTNAALLLNETDKIRFVPNADFNGNDQPLGFKVWDKSSGTAGSQADTSTSTAFSANPANALLDVTPVNDAPTNPINLELSSIPKDVAPGSNTGTLVLDIVTGSGSIDVDSAPLGIAVTTRDNTNGVWQFSSDGGANWNSMPPVADNAAFLLNETDKIRFVPNANFNGNDQVLSFKVWDKSSGTAGSQVDTSTSLAFSANPANALLDVILVNDAPTNPVNLDLAPIPEDIASGSNNGTLVSDIVTGSGSTDSDSTPLGIAVTTRDNTNGAWQFSTDNGVSWNAIGVVSKTSALLLNQTDKIRFVPNANFNGNNQVLGFKVWDKSSGIAGTNADTSASTAFSANAANALLDITPINDVPTNPGNLDLPSIPKDVPSGSNTGTPVSIIVNGSGSIDVDGTPLGIAVTNATNPNGIWQFSTNNGASWNAIGNVSVVNALLLNKTDKIRFVPNLNFSGNDQALSFKVWDKSSGIAGSKADTNGSLAFSSNNAKAFLDVIPVINVIPPAPAPIVAQTIDPVPAPKIVQNQQINNILPIQTNKDPNNLMEDPNNAVKSPVPQNPSLDPAKPYLSDDDFNKYETPESPLDSPTILMDAQKNNAEYVILGGFNVFNNLQLIEIIKEAGAFEDIGDFNTENLLDALDKNNKQPTDVMDKIKPIGKDNEQPTDVMDRIKTMQQSSDQEVLNILNDIVK